MPATELITGLGFALSFGHASRLYLECPGALPDGGLTLDIRDHGVDHNTAEILQHAVIVTTTLAELTALDGRPRYLSPSGPERDVAIAQLVHGLLRHGELRQPLTRPYRYSIPDDAGDKDPDKLMRGVRRALGALAGQPTVVAELRIEGPAEARVMDIDGRTVLEAVPRDDDGAEVVMSLVGPVANDADVSTGEK